MNVDSASDVSEKKIRKGTFAMTCDACLGGGERGRR